MWYLPIALGLSDLSPGSAHQLIRLLPAAFLELASHLPYHIFRGLPLTELGSTRAAALPPAPQLCALKANSQIMFCNWGPSDPYCGS